MTVLVTTFPSYMFSGLPCCYWILKCIQKYVLNVHEIKHCNILSKQNFISKCLESKEATITKLNDDGEKLVASDHPGKNVIEVHINLYFVFYLGINIDIGFWTLIHFIRSSASNVFQNNLFICKRRLLC